MRQAGRSFGAQQPTMSVIGFLGVVAMPAFGAGQLDQLAAPAATVMRGCPRVSMRTRPPIGRTGWRACLRNGCASFPGPLTLEVHVAESQLAYWLSPPARRIGAAAARPSHARMHVARSRQRGSSTNVRGPSRGDQLVLADHLAGTFDQGCQRRGCRSAASVARERVTSRTDLQVATRPLSTRAKPIDHASPHLTPLLSAPG